MRKNSRRTTLFLFTLVSFTVASAYLFVPPLSKEDFFYPTQGRLISSPVIGDIDNDGDLEVVVGCMNGNLYVFSSDGEVVQGFPIKTGPVFSSPALADLDGDGHLEIIFSSEDGNIYAFRHDATLYFNKSLGAGILWSSPTIFVRDGGDLGIIQVGSGSVVIIDDWGDVVSEWKIDSWADSTPSVGKHNKDTVVVVGTLGHYSKYPESGSIGKVYAWFENGTCLKNFPIYLSNETDSSPALADLNQDGSVEIVIGDDDGFIHAFSLSGVEIEGFPIRVSGIIEASPAIGDVNDDSFPEIVVGSWDSYLYIFSHKGKLIQKFKTGDHIISSSSLVNIDDDPQLEIIVGSKDAYLYALNLDGSPVNGFPKNVGESIFSSPAVVDINKNGYADIIVGADNGLHILYNVGKLGKSEWGSFHHDNWHTGNYHQDSNCMPAFRRKR